MTSQGVYWAMWQEIKQLTPEGRERWIENIGSPRGNEVDFRGVKCCDVDLVEALKNSR